MLLGKVAPVDLLDKGLPQTSIKKKKAPSVRCKKVIKCDVTVVALKNAVAHPGKGKTIAMVK